MGVDSAVQSFELFGLGISRNWLHVLPFLLASYVPFGELFNSASFAPSSVKQRTSKECLAELLGGVNVKCMSPPCSVPGTLDPPNNRHVTTLYGLFAVTASIVNVYSTISK